MGQISNITGLTKLKPALTANLQDGRTTYHSPFTPQHMNAIPKVQLHAASLIEQCYTTLENVFQKLIIKIARKAPITHSINAQHVCLQLMFSHITLKLKMWPFWNPVHYKHDYTKNMNRKRKENVLREINTQCLCCNSTAKVPPRRRFL